MIEFSYPTGSSGGVGWGSSGSCGGAGVSMIHLPQLSSSAQSQAPSTRVAMSVSTQSISVPCRDQRGLRLTAGSRRRTGVREYPAVHRGIQGDHGAEGSHSGFFPLALSLPQHPCEHRSQSPVPRSRSGAQRSHQKFAVRRGEAVSPVA